MEGKMGTAEPDPDEVERKDAAPTRCARIVTQERREFLHKDNTRYKSITSLSFITCYVQQQQIYPLDRGRRGPR